jgi:hypothetical protein
MAWQLLSMQKVSKAHPLFHPLEEKTPQVGGAAFGKIENVCQDSPNRGVQKYQIKPCLRACQTQGYLLHV